MVANKQHEDNTPTLLYKKYTVTITFILLLSIFCLFQPYQYGELALKMCFIITIIGCISFLLDYI